MLIQTLGSTAVNLGVLDFKKDSLLDTFVNTYKEQSSNDAVQNATNTKGQMNY